MQLHVITTVCIRFVYIYHVFGYGKNGWMFKILTLLLIEFRSESHANFFVFICV